MSQISAFGVDHGVEISKRGGKIARLLGRGAKGARGAKKVVPAPRVSGPGPKGPGGPPRPGSPGYQPIGPGPTGPGPVKPATPKPAPTPKETPLGTYGPGDTYGTKAKQYARETAEIKSGKRSGYSGKISEAERQVMLNPMDRRAQQLFEGRTRRVGGY